MQVQSPGCGDPSAGKVDVKFALFFNCSERVMEDCGASFVQLSGCRKLPLTDLFSLVCNQNLGTGARPEFWSVARPAAGGNAWGKEPTLACKKCSSFFLEHFHCCYFSINHVYIFNINYQLTIKSTTINHVITKMAQPLFMALIAPWQGGRQSRGHPKAPGDFHGGAALLEYRLPCLGIQDPNIN